MGMISVSAPVDIHVRSETVESPLAEIFPFKFDRVIVQREDPLDTLGMWLNDQEWLLKEGTALDQWASGHIQPVRFERLEVGVKDFQRTHNPIVTSGLVSFGWDEREVRGDTSALVVCKDTYLIESNLAEVELPAETIGSSLEARIFVRTSDNEALTLYEWKLVSEFTGEMGEDIRVPTEDESGFLPESLSSRHREMVYRDESAYLSNPTGPWITTGDEPLTIELLTTYWEYAGVIGGGRTIATKYFPIQANSVRLCVIDGTEITEFNLLETLDFMPGEDFNFEVDEALGLVKIGGYSAADLVLSEDVTSDADYIPFFFEEHHVNYPSRGVINIGSELIMYEEKTSLGFSSLTRGHEGSTAAAHTKGDLIVEPSRGVYKRGNLYISYKSVPRIEYDVAHSTRSTNKEGKLDVKASNVIASSGLLVLGTEVLSLGSIELKSDSKKLAADYYGPIYFGTDASLLTATCLSEQGRPVEGIDVTLEIITGHGVIGDGQSIVRTSNSEGEIYGLFSSPLTDTSGLYVINSYSYDGTNTTLGTRYVSNTLRNEQFWLFQVLKCDPVYGTVGIRSSTSALESDPGIPESNCAVTINGSFWDQNIAYIDILTSASVIQRFTVLANSRVKIGDVHFTRFELAEAPASGSAYDSTCWLLGPEDVEWNGDAPDGLRRIVYAWNASAIHPITEAEGAYSPVMPDTVNGNRFIFNNKELPEPDASDRTNNLGAYLVYGPEEAFVRARAIDPLSGQTIYSNTVRLKILMSSALLGVEFSDNLPIPYGFRLYTEAHNNSNSIGGANFYTINPNANGISQLPILGVL